VADDLTKPEASEALETLNVHLNLDLLITVKGDELKGRCPDLDEGGTQRLYLTADDCESCAQAFAVLASELRKQKEKSHVR
jgi:hypothetical protein